MPLRLEDPATSHAGPIDAATHVSRYGSRVRKAPVQQVAHVYSNAAATGHAPTLAVEKRFGVSRSTAGRWVAAARSAGLLEPVGQGRSPRLNRKIAAVARALGVDPQALRKAIVQHANGDLRVDRTRGG